MSLLYRGLQRSNESIDDYLGRLACWNGFGSRKKFLNWLDGVYESHYGDSDWYVDGEEWNYHHMRWFKHQFALEVLLRRSVSVGVMLSRCGLYNTEPFVCPDCWAADQYVRAYWNLEEYWRCHIHSKKMLPFDGYDSEVAGTGALMSQTHDCDLVLYKAIELFGNRDGCLGLILEERAMCDIEYELIEWLYDYLRKKVRLKVEKKSAIDLCVSGEFVGLSVTERMERYAVELVKCDCEETASAVRVIAALRVKRTSAPSSRVHFEQAHKKIDNWANSEILSADQLVSEYIKLKKNKSKHEEFSFQSDFPCLGNLGSSVNYYLWQMLRFTELRGPYRADWQNEEVEMYLRKLESNRQYNDSFCSYLEDQGYEVLRSC